MTKARSIETSGFLWLEEGERREATVAEVAPVIPVDKTYSFAVPASLESSLALGHRVRVPMGRRGRMVEGFVVGLDRRPWESTLRPIGELVDAASFLTPELLALGREISLHYCCPLGRTLKAITPEPVRRERGLRTVRYARLAQSLAEIEQPAGRLSAKRRAVIDALLSVEGAVEVERLLSESGASAAVLRGMVQKGWVEIEPRKELHDDAFAFSTLPLAEPTFTLNDEQRTALLAIREAIDAQEFSVTLLYGVSGSGKTEVYIQAMRHVVGAGKQAVLLVPEIVLTTQLVQRLASRFADVAVSHSGLTGAQRSVIWRQVAVGEKAVVVGTRSTVFAPCPNLGLICVDEEQESSYKNLRAPRFNVRDVAIMRAKLGRIPVVLGSATPLVETWYHSEHRPDYRRVVLAHRVRELPMPKLNVVDMHDEYAERGRSVVFSRLMERLLEDTLSRSEQAVLLVNRRGFARRVYCPACRMQLVCPNCNVGLVVHRAKKQALCHYCRSRIPIPSVCPNVTCGEKLVELGLGTERVEEELDRRFSKARVQRVDSDTMRHRDEYRRTVADFEARNIDILVGTQMIAKGLDFPFVSFVGVVHADAGGLASDFRAHERLFQLITQVAGRAGRGDAPGRVVVQTTSPELPALKHALVHDYESFAAAELGSRKRVGLPPFRRLARIVVGHPREETARRAAEEVWQRGMDAIKELALEHADLLGPNPCVISRLRGRYRYDLLIRTLGASDLRKLMQLLQTGGAFQTKAESTIIDVDPVAMM